MGNKITLIGILILVALVAGFVFAKSGNTDSVPITGNVVAGEIQKVVLSQDDLNYKDVRVQAGKPIAINADSSVTGCLRAPAFNFGGKKYSKYFYFDHDGHHDNLLPPLPPGSTGGSTGRLPKKT